MKRMAHYTCRHSCNCDGRVRRDIYPGRSARPAAYVCLHLGCIFFHPLSYLALVLATLDLGTSTHLRVSAKSGASRGRKREAGYGRNACFSKVTRTTWNYTVLFAEMIFTSIRSRAKVNTIAFRIIFKIW